MNVAAVDYKKIYDGVKVEIRFSHNEVGIDVVLRHADVLRVVELAVAWLDRNGALPEAKREKFVIQTMGEVYETDPDTGERLPCSACGKPVVPVNTHDDVYSVCETCPKCSGRMCGSIVCPHCSFDTAR